jgi:hypothetical protein
MKYTGLLPYTGGSIYDRQHSLYNIIVVDRIDELHIFKERFSKDE